MTEKPVSRNIGIKTFLDSAEPLSEEAVDALLDHAEEDLHVDYKESFDPKNDKCWIDTAVDATAFANTHGGYLVFGIQDKTYKKIGITEDAQVALADIKVVSEKLSRNLRPNFRGLRSLGFSKAGLNFAILYIPPTLDRTHIFEEDMTFRPATGQPHIVARKGSIYVRKSGSIQIMTSDDFEEVLSRRTQRIREKLFEGVSKVMKAGPEHEFLVVAPDESSGQKRSFKVVDAPDAVAIKGLSLIAAPSTPEGKIALLQATHKMREKDLPHRENLMEFYVIRESLNLTPDQCEWLVEVSLRREAPCFYWLAKCKEPRTIIARAFAQATRIEKFHILKVAAFYGKGFYNDLRRGQHGASVRDQTSYPDRLDKPFRTGKLTDRDSFEELQKLATNLSRAYSEQELTGARKLDCGIYAPFT